MRDPGAPRRNPFFVYDADAAAGDPGPGWRDEPDAGDLPPTDGLSALLALVDGLASAQPEAAAHLVAAAHEVVLAVKTVVDATEAVLAEQRALLADPRERS